MTAIRSIQFEAPMTAFSRVGTDDGRTLSVADAAAEMARGLEVTSDAALADRVGRAASGELVLPGADRWRSRVAAASPSSPVRVPALERNARVVEIEMARDALADPLHPSRFQTSDGLVVSVLGAASRSWRAGDVEFDVVTARGPERFRLSDEDRRRLWRHLTGLLKHMRIRPDMVSFEGDADDRPWPGGTPTATAAIVGVGESSAYVYSGEPAEGVRIREDGDVRLDQQVRTAVAEQAAWLIRQWRAELGPPRIGAVAGMRAYDGAGGRDDMAESASAGALAAAAAAGALAAGAAGAAVLAVSERARSGLGSLLGRLSPSAGAP